MIMGRWSGKQKERGGLRSQGTEGGRGTLRHDTGGQAEEEGGGKQARARGRRETRSQMRESCEEKSIDSKSGKQAVFHFSR